VPAQLRSKTLGCLEMDIRDAYSRSFVDEGTHNLSADAAGATGNDGGLAFQSHG
jgi:hypothetical protein